METGTVEVRTRTVELSGGRVLHVCRFTDPTTGRDVLTLATGYSDSSPLPAGRDQEVVELPGSVTEKLVEALQALDGGGAP